MCLLHSPPMNESSANIHYYITAEGERIATHHIKFSVRREERELCLLLPLLLCYTIQHIQLLPLMLRVPNDPKYFIHATFALLMLRIHASILFVIYVIVTRYFGSNGSPLIPHSQRKHTSSHLNSHTARAIYNYSFVNSHAVDYLQLY